MPAGGGSGAVRIPFIGDASSVKRASREAEAAIKRLDAAGDKANRRLGGMGAAAKTTALVGVGALSVATLKFGKDAISAAKDAEASMARVQKMVENAGFSWEKHSAQIDKAIQTQSKMSGLDDEGLAESFANMLRTTGDVNKALELNVLVMDLARTKGLSLDAAQKLVARTYNGNFVALNKMGIATKDLANGQEGLAVLQQKFGGQAEAYGRTTAGATDRLKVSWENFQESVGQRVMPVLARLLQRLADVGDWLAANWPGIWARVRAAVEPVINALMPIVEPVMKAIVAAFRLVSSFIRGDWGEAWKALKSLVGNALKGLVELVKLGAEVGLKIGKAIGAALANGLIALVEWGVNKALAGINKVGGLLNKVLPGDPIGKIGNVKLGRVNDGSTPAAAVAAPDTSAARRAGGGFIPGNPSVGDRVPALLTPGEVVLNRRQQMRVGVGRIFQALAETGGVLGGNRFAAGGIATAAAFARAQVGERYIYGAGHDSTADRNGWDCSGFASAVASRVPGYTGGIGTTMSLYPRSTIAKGGELVVFGFRGMGQRDPRKQHMGIRVGGVWYDAGSGGVQVGDSRWESVRVPPGLTNLKADAAPAPGPVKPSRQDGLFTFEEWKAYHRRIGTPASGLTKARWETYLAKHRPAVPGARGTSETVGTDLRGPGGSPLEGNVGDGATEPVREDENLQALLAQANSRAAVAQRAAGLSDSFIRTALGPGDLGRGARTAWEAAGGGLNFTIQMLDPGSAAQQTSLAETITKALAALGATSNAAVQVGLA